MRKVLFEGYWFKVCKNETELKKEIIKVWGEIHPGQELHHIFGRVGILKLMPDNVMPVNSNYHRMQKSLDLKQRIVFQDMVSMKIDMLIYNRLSRLADYIKNINVLFGK